MVVVKGRGHIVSPAFYYFTSFTFHISQTNISWDTSISKFDLETSKVKVMGKVNGQGHILYPVSNRCTSCSFHINQTNHSWDMAKVVFDLEKTNPKFERKFAKITISNSTSLKSNQVIPMTRAIELLCFVVIGWVVLIVQTSKFLLIYATAVTLGQCHGKSSSTFCQSYIFFAPNI